MCRRRRALHVDSKVLKADTASRMSEDRNPRARRLRVEAADGRVPDGGQRVAANEDRPRAA